METTNNIENMYNEEIENVVIENNMEEINGNENEIVENLPNLIQGEVLRYKQHNKFGTLMNQLENIYNLTIEDDNTAKLNKFKEIELSTSYIAGFVDGDGYVYIKMEEINKANNSGETSNEDTKKHIIYRYGLCIGQARTNILKILRYYYGGNIYSTQKYDDDVNINENGLYDRFNRRNMYAYNVNSYYCKYIYKDIFDKLVIKNKQVDKIMDFIYLNELKDTNNEEQKRECYENMQKLHLSVNMEDDFYNYENLTIEYIAGLFDAEGCISLNQPFDEIFSRPKIGISQKNHPNVLLKIIDFLGYGSIENNNTYIVSGNNAYNLICQIIDFTVVKYNQLLAVKLYWESKPLFTKKEKNDNLFMSNYVKRILNKEKHQSEDYTPSNNESIDGFLKKVDDKFIKTDGQNRKLKSCNEIKSERMQGQNHYFYGKNFVENHKNNLGRSIAESRRSENLSDENIKRIMELLNNNVPQVDIIKEFEEKKLSLNRDSILNIKKGKIRPISDYAPRIESDKEKFFKNMSAANRTSMNKRKLGFDKYIELLNWRKSIYSSYGNERFKTEGYKQIMKWKKDTNNKLCLGIPLLVDYLNSQFNFGATKDIIKNFWDGKTELFREEFDYYNPENLTYNEYRNMIFNDNNDNNDVNNTSTNDDNCTNNDA